jgi:hypothetical protein
MRAPTDSSASSSSASGYSSGPSSPTRDTFLHGSRAHELEHPAAAAMEKYENMIEKLPLLDAWSEQDEAVCAS